jgi:hypothetical protein
MEFNLHEAMDAIVAFNRYTQPQSGGSFYLFPYKERHSHQEKVIMGWHVSRSVILLACALTAVMLVRKFFSNSSN